MQNEESQINYKNANNIKRRLKAAKISSYETKLDSLRFSVKQKKNNRRNEISNKIGSSNWVSVITMKEYNYTLSNN